MVRRYSIAQLEALEAISRLGSHAAAAKSLNITQPTASLRIRSLEQALATKLFQPDGRKVRLTSDGLVVLNYAQRVLKLLDEMQTHLETGDPLAGIVRVGSSETVAIAVLPKIIARLSDRYPDLKVELSVNNSFVLADELVAGRLDAAILADPQVSSRIHTQPLACAPVAWVGHVSLNLKQSVVTPELMAQQAIFSMPEPSPLHQRIVNWWEVETESRLALTMSTCNSVAMLARMVTGGLGVSVLPTCILREEIRKGEIITYQQQSPFEPLGIYLAYPERNRSSGLSQLHEIAKTTMLESRYFIAPSKH